MNVLFFIVSILLLINSGLNAWVATILTRLYRHTIQSGDTIPALEDRVFISLVLLFSSIFVAATILGGVVGADGGLRLLFLSVALVSEILIPVRWLRKFYGGGFSTKVRTESQTSDDSDAASKGG